MNKQEGNSNRLLTLFVLAVIVSGFIFINVKNMNKNKKINEYNEKINLIEQRAISYGKDNKSLIMKGKTIANDVSSTVRVTTDEKGNVTSLVFNSNIPYSDTEELNNNEYRGNYIFVKDLVEMGQLKWDKENQCSKCSTEHIIHYNNVIINPTNNNIINGCKVYIYYKDNEIKSYFDKTTCDKTTGVPGFIGKEYSPRE